MAAPTSREETNLWLARIERGLREEEGPALREWLKQPANRKTILESAQLWHAPEVYSLVSSLVPAKDLLPEKPRRSLYKLSVAAGLVAALGIVGVSAALGVTPWAYLRGERPSRYLMPAGVYATTIGETQKVTLNDASEITLNTRSSVIVAYSPSSRDVFLRIWRSELRRLADQGPPLRRDGRTPSPSGRPLAIQCSNVTQWPGGRDGHRRRSDGALRDPEVAGRSGVTPRRIHCVWRGGAERARLRGTRPALPAHESARSK